MLDHDSLTGLLNRAAFRDLVSEALNDRSKVNAEPTVLFIDLDRFKAVNDVHGHEIGDKLLQQVATRLTEVAGEAGTVARLGGDEFATFMFEPTSTGAGMVLAQRIVAAAATPFLIDGQPFQVGASCGVARASECDYRLEAMLKGADLAMYQAKIAGRGRPVLFEQRMLEEQRERNALEVELRNAIQAGVLEVYFQPLVNTNTDEITAFEALVRWPHPERGNIPPDTFIPLAEETGLDHPSRQGGAPTGLSRSDQLAGSHQGCGEPLAAAVPRSGTPELHRGGSDVDGPFTEAAGAGSHGNRAA